VLRRQRGEDPANRADQRVVRARTSDLRRVIAGLRAQGMRALPCKCVKLPRFFVVVDAVPEDGDRFIEQ